MKLPLRTRLLLGLTLGVAGWRVWLWATTPPVSPTPPLAVELAPRPAPQAADSGTVDDRR